MDDDEHAGRPVRLMTFISEEQLDQAKKARGERADDGTAQRDRPLFEILKENKDRKDAEFNERFKHRPPKALDEDETEFLDKWEMSKKAHERQVAEEEAEQLRRFQEAVAAQSSMVREIKETPAIPRPEVMFPQDQKPAVKRNKPVFPGNFTIYVRPQAKKAKTAQILISLRRIVNLPMDGLMKRNLMRLRGLLVAWSPIVMEVMMTDIVLQYRDILSISINRQDLDLACVPRPDAVGFYDPEVVLLFHISGILPRPFSDQALTSMH